MALGSRVRKQYCGLFEERQQSYDAFATNVNTASGCRSYSQVKKRLLVAGNINCPSQAKQSGRLKVSETSSAAVPEFKDPTTQTGLISFLGFCNVFCCFVLKFGKVVAPLSKKLRNDWPASFLSFTANKTCKRNNQETTDKSADTSTPPCNGLSYIQYWCVRLPSEMCTTAEKEDGTSRLIEQLSSTLTSAEEKVGTYPQIFPGCSI